MSLAIDYLNWLKYRGPSQHADNFGVWVFALIAKADKENRERLMDVFPAHVELWEHMHLDPSFTCLLPVTYEYLIKKMGEWRIPDFNG